ncbi:MAG: hypothetical protein ACT4PT_09110 [Methanobacteriota archaeon]
MPGRRRGVAIRAGLAASLDGPGTKDARPLLDSGARFVSWVADGYPGAAWTESELATEVVLEMKIPGGTGGPSA